MGYWMVGLLRHGSPVTDTAAHKQTEVSHEPHYLHRRPGCRCPGYHLVSGFGMTLAKSKMTGSRRTMMRSLGALCLTTQVATAEQVGNVDVDWLGNDIVIEAFSDPLVDGVTCHVAYFERGLIDRLQNGNWFEDPSNSSIACRQTGAITIGDIDRSDEGESVFSERRSIIWKSLNIKRILDEENQTLIYIAHAREVQNGSAKMSISTVPLFQN